MSKRRRQKAEGSRQKAVGRGQKAGSSWWEAEDRIRKTEEPIFDMRERGQKAVGQTSGVLGIGSSPSGYYSLSGRKGAWNCFEKSFVIYPETARDERQEFFSQTCCKTT
jgi:hypothetical protein